MKYRSKVWKKWVMIDKLEAEIELLKMILFHHCRSEGFENYLIQQLLPLTKAVRKLKSM